MDFSLAWELEARDVSQSELARATGLPQQTISDIARGISPGRPATRRKIREALVKYPLRYRGSSLYGKSEITVTPGPRSTSIPVHPRTWSLADPWSVLPPIEQEPLSHRVATLRFFKNPNPSGGIPVVPNPRKRSASARRSISGSLIAVRTFEYTSKAGVQVRVEAGRTRVSANHEAARRFPNSFVDDPRSTRPPQR